jgi:hypothetical protein
MVVEMLVTGVVAIALAAALHLRPELVMRAVLFSEARAARYVARAKERRGFPGTSSASASSTASAWLRCRVNVHETVNGTVDGSVDGRRLQTWSRPR